MQNIGKEKAKYNAALRLLFKKYLNNDILIPIIVVGYFIFEYLINLLCILSALSLF